MEVFEFRGYQIPVELLLRTGGGPETFEIISDQHVRNVSSQHPLTPGLHVLEIGCGIGRDAIPLADLVGPSGSYCGTDIIEESIEWCSSNISVRNPNFRFVWHDIEDSLHNPAGSTAANEIRLPADDNSIDLVIAQSVFTHMLPAAFTHFLREAERVLKADGTIYATCFRVNHQILAIAREKNLTQYDLRFDHEFADGCYVNELDHLTGAVAYTQQALDRMVEDAKLRFSGPPRLGGWSGAFAVPFDGQDVLVLRK